MIFGERDYYKPFMYPWAFEYFKQQHQSHWMPESVPMAQDVRDWQTEDADTKELLRNVFRFFTQADMDVGSNYYDTIIPWFHHPELRMMLGAFADMEGIHQYAYSYLLDTIGLPEREYKAFAEYPEMVAKHEYYSTLGVDGSEPTIPAMLRFIAANSAFGEGMQLFSTFALLMNLPRNGKYIGVGQIIAWSIRDETLHVEGMLKLFNTIVDEHPDVWTDDFKRTIYNLCRNMVKLEDAFIDLIYKDVGSAAYGLSKDELKEYIRYIADRRLLQMRLKPNYNVTNNPLPWLDDMLAAPEFTNFFETTPTEYSKHAWTGSWDEVWADAAPHTD